MNSKLSSLTTETLTNLSGVYSPAFWDAVYEVSGSLETVKGLQSVITTLYSLNKNSDAMLLISSLFDLLGLNFPEELQIVEQNEELQNHFISECLKDIEDLMYDYTAEQD